jgi:hypothetical protein
LVQAVRDRRIRDPWFAKVWHAAGLRGKPPPVWVSKNYAGMPAKAANVAGWQPDRNRRIYLTPEILMGLKQTRQGKRYDLAALQVLLHEMAHVAQPTVLRTRVVEGGAEAFAHHNVERIAKKLYPPDIHPEMTHWMSPLYGVQSPSKKRWPYPAYYKYEQSIDQPTRDYYQFGKAPPRGKPSRRVRPPAKK